MTDSVTLSCPTCGGKLQITNDIVRFACAHCGNEHVVKRMGGIISIFPAADNIAKDQVVLDKTASEPELRQVKKDIFKTEQQILRVRDSLAQAYENAQNGDPIDTVISKYLEKKYYPRRGGLKKLSFEPDRTILELMSVDEVLQMADYFMEDPYKYHPRFSGQRDAFVMIRERLKPLKELSEQLNTTKATLTPEDEMPIYCPECLKDDRIFKVSAIYSGGIAHGTFAGFEGTMSGTSQTLLSGKLAPLPKPSISISATLLIGLCIIAAVGTGAWWLLTAASAGTGNPIGQIWLKVTAVIVGVGLLIYLLGSLDVKLKMPQWTATMEVWNRFYYCDRNGIVFDPSSGRSMPIDRFANYLREYHKALSN